MSLCRRVNICLDDVTRWQGNPPMPKQRGQPPPMQPLTGLPLQTDRYDRITVVRVFLDLVSDYGEQQAVIALAG